MVKLCHLGRRFHGPGSVHHPDDIQSSLQFVSLARRLNKLQQFLVLSDFNLVDLVCDGRVGLVDFAIIGSNVTKQIKLHLFLENLFFKLTLGDVHVEKRNARIDIENDGARKRRFPFVTLGGARDRAHEASVPGKSMSVD